MTGHNGAGIAILMPAYNEAETIATVVRSVRDIGTPLVVDDGSDDDTAALAEAAGAKVVILPTNRGYEGALEAGFERAVQLSMGFVVSYDADGQFEVADLRAAVALLQQGQARLVLGQRAEAARFGEWLFNFYTKKRFGVPDILCGLKGYDLALYKEHAGFSGRSVGTRLALAALRAGERATMTPVTVLARTSGPSRFGSTLRANRRLLLALADALWADFGQVR